MMVGGRPPAGTGGSGSVEVPTIPADAPKPAPATAIPPTLVLGYLDLAIRGALEYERYARVYLSPWWAVEDPPEGMSIWKRAVLERIPLRGALHWGHLYLVVSDARPIRPLLRLFRSSPIGGGIERRPDEVHVALREGVQLAELVLHPTRPERSEDLVGFAHEVEIRFRRQMD